MITPLFKIRQDDDNLFIDIYAKFVKANDVEIYVEGNMFKFYVKPYFLRLNLPGKLCEECEESGKYDVGEGIFHFKLKKATPGEFFQDLDMVTTLMATRKELQIPLIEEISTDLEKKLKVSEEEEHEEEKEEEDWDWCQQTSSQNVEDLTGKYKYGFANSFQDALSKFQEETEEFIDIPSPDTTSHAERRKLRIHHENNHFNVEHYMADYVEWDNMSSLVNFAPPWLSKMKNSEEKNEHFDMLHFTDEEEKMLTLLPNKDYLLSSLDERKCLLSLVDLLFAYCYDHRTTEGENTSESPWTICKLSSTLSWFDSFQTIDEVVVNCCRRALCYPLYRNWQLILIIWNDVKEIMMAGKVCIIKCLLDMRGILMRDESRYILNELYVNHYIVWVQKVSLQRLSSIAEALKEKDIQKEVVGFNLEQIESVFLNNNQDDISSSSTSTEEDSSSEDEESDQSLDSDDEPTPPPP
ncbi:protein SHQ1 homolog [Clytia hemisphaerica]